MSPSPEKQVSRWTAEEDDIVMRMADEQLALEKDFPSEEISWTSLWRKVSKCLEEKGYGRSPNACNHRYRKVKEHEELAGPPWDALEHRILFGVTKSQLDLEKRDPSKQIPWPKLWKRVSRKLFDNGYERSPDSCAAYYTIIEMHQGSSILDSSLRSASDKVDNQPSYSSIPDTRNSPASRRSSSLSSWSPDNEIDDTIFCIAPMPRSLVRRNSLKETVLQPTQTKTPLPKPRSPRAIPQNKHLPQFETSEHRLSPRQGNYVTPTLL